MAKDSRAEKAAAKIQAIARGEKSRRLSKSLTSRRSGSESAQKLQHKAYRRLSQEQKKKSEDAYSAKIARELSDLKMEEMKKERLSKLNSAKQKKAERDANMNDQERNYYLKQNVTDDVLNKIDLIKKKVLAQAYGANPHTFLRRLITKYDLDGNKSLDRTEFTHMMRAHLSQTEASTLFAFVDANDTGSITEGELAEFFALDSLVAVSSAENLSRRAVPSSPRSRIAFLYELLANVPVPVSSRTSSYTNNRSDNSNHLYEFPFRCSRKTGDTSFVVRLLQDFSRSTSNHTRRSSNTTLTENRRQTKSKNELKSTFASTAANVDTYIDTGTWQAHRLMAMGGMVALLWQLAMNKNRDFFAEENYLVEKIEALKNNQQSSQGILLVQEMEQKLNQVEAARCELSKLPREAQRWYSLQIEPEALCAATRDDNDRLRLLDFATRGPCLSDEHRMAIVIILVEMLRTISKALAGGSSYSKTMQIIDAPAKGAVALMLFRSVFTMQQKEEHDINEAVDESLSLINKSVNAQQSLQERIATMQAQMAATADAMVDNNDDHNDEGKLMWECQNPLQLEIQLRLVFIQRNVFLEKQRHDADMNDSKVSSRKVDIAFVKEEMFNTQVLCAALLLVSPALRAETLQKVSKTLASQIIAQSSTQELSRLYTHLAGDEEEDKQAKEYHSLPSLPTAVTKLLMKLSEIHRNIVMDSADKHISMMNNRAARLRKARLAKMTEAERQRNEVQSARLKLQVLEEDQKRRRVRDRKRREIEAKKKKEMEGQLAAMQLETIRRDQEVRKQKHIQALKRQQKQDMERRKLASQRRRQEQDTQDRQAKNGMTDNNKKYAKNNKLIRQVQAYDASVASMPLPEDLQNAVKRARNRAKSKTFASTDKYMLQKRKFYPDIPKKKELWEIDVSTVLAKPNRIRSDHMGGTMVVFTANEEKVGNRDIGNERIKQFLKSKSGMRPPVGTKVRNFDRTILNRFLPHVSVLSSSGCLMPPSPEFAKLGKSASVNSDKEEGERPRRHVNIRQKHRANSLSLTRRDNQVELGNYIFDDVQSSKETEQQQFTAGQECEVKISDSIMVKVGLLPSIIDARVASYKLQESLPHNKQGSVREQLQSAETSAPKGQTTRPHGETTKLVPDEKAAKINSKKLSDGQRSAAEDSMSEISPTYSQSWVKAVVIAAHADQTYDVFLPSSINNRYLKPMVTRIDASHLRVAAVN